MELSRACIELIIGFFPMMTATHKRLSLRSSSIFVNSVVFYAFEGKDQKFCIMSLEIFKSLFHKSYNAIDACKRQNLDESMLEPFRVRLKTAKFVPKCVVNSQVMTVHS